jgi:hypothetical protein
VAARKLGLISQKTKLAEAIGYALSRREGLTFFVGGGGIELLEAPLSSALPFVASMRSCAIWAASSMAPFVIRKRRCVSSSYWERAFCQNCTYARCILGNPLHSRSVWSSWESSCNRAPTKSVHSLPRACRVVLNFEFCFAVSVSVLRLVSMNPAKSKNGTESGNLPE